jgi:hypothetical protein
MEVSSYNFKQQIIKDYKLTPDKKHIIRYNQFPMKNGKRKISSPHNSTIVDKEGNEYPYMLTHNQRNAEKLKDFDHIYFMQYKSLDEITREAGITLKTEPCRICEGGGWYSNGRRYYYKDLTCEF